MALALGLIVLVAPPLLIFGVLHVILARKWTFIVAPVFFVLPLLCGAAGYALGASRVEVRRRSRA